MSTIYHPPRGGSGGGVSTLDDVGDVVLSSLALGDTVKWNGSVWVNTTLADLGLDASHIGTGTFADARIAESNVTQHEAALAIATSQLTGDMPDARIVESNVTQHEAALAITEAQISDLQAYLTDITAEVLGDLSDVVLTAIGDGQFLKYDQGTTNWINHTLTEADISDLQNYSLVGHSHDTGDITTGTMADARIAQSNVTQHQAALAIATTQLTGDMPDARIAQSNVTQHQAALAIATTQLTGDMPDARIVEGNVTQHEAALSIAASQVTGTLAAGNLPAASSSAQGAVSYEGSGTWTPSLTATGAGFSSVTYVTQTGRYYRIGSLCIVTFTVQWSAASGGSGNLAISGLPFAANSGSSVGYTGFFEMDNLDLANNSAHLGGSIFPSATVISLFQNSDVSTAIGLGDSLAKSAPFNKKIRGSIVYWV